MKKYLVLAAAFMFTAPIAYAGYDLSLENIEGKTAISSGDLASTDLLQVFRTGTGESEVIVATDLINPVVTPTTLGAAETLTNASYAGRTLCFGSVAGTATLPAATGTGAVYRFTACAVPPGNGYVITVTGDDTIDGQFISLKDSADTVDGWETAANTDTITFTSSTKGAAAIGAWVELQDIGADQWTVRGQGTSTGSEATPFSGS